MIAKNINGGLLIFVAMDVTDSWNRHLRLAEMGMNKKSVRPRIIEKNARKREQGHESVRYLRRVKTSTLRSAIRRKSHHLMYQSLARRSAMMVRARCLFNIAQTTSIGFSSQSYSKLGLFAQHNILTGTCADSVGWRRIVESFLSQVIPEDLGMYRLRCMVSRSPPESGEKNKAH